MSLDMSEWSPRRYAYIDTLRGYAILMVIAVHTSQAFSNLPTWRPGCGWNIRSGVISDIVKLSDYAARSIG